MNKKNVLIVVLLSIGSLIFAQIPVPPPPSTTTTTTTPPPSVSTPNPMEEIYKQMLDCINQRQAEMKKALEVETKLRDTLNALSKDITTKEMANIQQKEKIVSLEGKNELLIQQLFSERNEKDSIRRKRDLLQEETNQQKYQIDTMTKRLQQITSDYDILYVKHNCSIETSGKKDVLIHFSGRIYEIKDTLFTLPYSVAKMTGMKLANDTEYNENLWKLAKILQNNKGKYKARVKVLGDLKSDQLDFVVNEVLKKLQEYGLTRANIEEIQSDSVFKDAYLEIDRSSTDELRIEFSIIKFKAK